MRNRPVTKAVSAAKELDRQTEETFAICRCAINRCREGKISHLPAAATANAAPAGSRRCSFLLCAACSGIVIFSRGRRAREADGAPAHGGAVVDAMRLSATRWVKSGRAAPLAKRARERCAQSLYGRGAALGARCDARDCSMASRA